ncbi:MAG: heme transporter CcmB [Lachnospiraceae bacterium]|nr:heme transporter CcmB [Lachnospiraceae bacterium]
MIKKEKNRSRAGVLNILLLVCFVVTMLVPLTGVHVHKLASTLFLLLSIVHAIIYRKKLGGKMVLVLVLVVVSFLSGLFGMIFDEYAIILQMHKAISILIVFFLAIHIFIYHKRFVAVE